MSAPSVTAEEYAAWFGEIGQGDFDAALPFAEAAVRDLVGFNEPSLPYELTAWKRAVCSAIRVDRAYGFSHGLADGLASVTLGSYSASSGAASDGSARSWEADVRDAARRELAGTGLLYQGIA